MTPSGNAWLSIQLFVLRRCAPTSSPGFPINSGLKWDHFNCDIGSGWTGRSADCTGKTAGCVGGAGGCMGGAGGTAAGATGGGWVVFHQWFYLFLFRRMSNLISTLTKWK